MQKNSSYEKYFNDAKNPVIINILIAVGELKLSIDAGNTFDSWQGQEKLLLMSQFGKTESHQGAKSLDKC